MVRHPVEKSWGRAARNVASGVAMLGIAALGGITFASLAPTFGAEVTTPVAAPKAESFTPRECVALLRQSSEAFRIVGNRGYNPEFPESIAGFIAPRNFRPVYNIIVNGNFDRLVDESSNAKNAVIKEAAVSAIKEASSTMTCDGSPLILTRGHAIDMWNSIRERLAENKTQPLDLQAKGLRSVDPAEVASLGPSVPLPAKSGPRTELQRIPGG
jgi:hypothetical protein